MIAWLKQRFGKAAPSAPVLALVSEMPPTPTPASAPAPDALEWLDAHKTELSIGVSPGGVHTRIYDHVTQLPHYGHTLRQAAASAQRSRESHEC